MGWQFTSFLLAAGVVVVLEPAKRSGKFEGFFTQDFVQSLIVLLLTAVVAGFAVPYLLRLIDERRAKQQRDTDDHRARTQKQYEAYLVRQSGIIDAQVRLLENVSKQLWGFIFLALAVSYYKVHADEDRHQKAFAAYDAKAWLFFLEIRAEISKARRLASPEMHAKLLELYYGTLIVMDSRLTSLVKRGVSGEDWKELHQWLFGDIAKEVDSLVNELSDELKLSTSGLK